MRNPKPGATLGTTLGTGVSFALTRLGSRDSKLEGLGTLIIRLGTSGLLLDARLDQNFTDWQTGLGRAGRCENGSIRLELGPDWASDWPWDGQPQSGP